MASIVRQKVGNHIYLYESISFRNQEGKPRNQRVAIGKIDRKTGLPVYKQDYIDRMRAKGVLVKSADCSPVFNVEDIRRSTILQTGMVHLLEGISENIGLSSILRQIFPLLHERIFAVAAFLLSCGEPVAYCADWMERSDFKNKELLSSQRISELLREISEEDQQRFFKAWSIYRRDRECFALDITSVSSWSQLIDDVEWGYNRDGDNLAQINLCMLLGYQSRLPIRMTVYNGSIKDVSTLETTIAQIDSCDRDEIMLVMDKGFSSIKNINMLLNKKGVRFLLALPLTLGFAKKMIQSEHKDIDNIQNTIVCGADTLRGVSLERSWSREHNLFVHVFYNDIKATAVKNQLYGYVRRLIEEARINPDNEKLKKEFAHYLIIRKSANHKSGYTINIRENVIDQELRHTGWLVTVSNRIQDASEALRVYRDKDVVEKGFMRLKHNLGLGRLRVHSQQAMESKVFVGFIALILNSHIHRIMLENDLYRKMTMTDLIKTMEKLRTQVVDGRRILFPLTKRQKEIYHAFELQPPV
jgi:transposase